MEGARRCATMDDGVGGGRAGGSREVEHEHFAFGDPGDDDPGLVGERDGVAGVERVAVDGGSAGGDVDPGVATGRERVLGALAGGEESGVEGDVLAEGHRAVATVRRGDEEIGRAHV